jgi:hypothetical protein
MAKSDWEVVKDPKKKPAAKESPNASEAQKAKKVTPKAVITATGDNKSKGNKKVQKMHLIESLNKILARKEGPTKETAIRAFTRDYRRACEINVNF